MFKKIIIGLALVLALAIPASARYVIFNDNGGSVQEYENKYVMLDQTEGFVKVAGECISACTLILAFMDKDHVCVDKQSWFGFHSVTEVNAQTHESRPSPEGTRYMWQLYPTYVQDILRARGWDGSNGDDHPELIMIKGTDFYKECEE